MSRSNKTISKFFLLPVLLCTVVFAQIYACASPVTDAESLFEQANKENAEGNYTDAETHLRAALKTSVGGMGAMSSLSGKLSRELGDFYVKRGRYAEAEHYYLRSLVITSNYSDALSDSEGDFRNVRGFLSNAIQNPEHLPASIEIANTLSSLADLYRRTNRLDDSERLFRRVINIYDGSGSANSQNFNSESKAFLQQNELNLAQVLYKQGKTMEAESAFKTYVEHARKLYGNSPKLADALNQLSAFYKSQNRNSDADASETESKEIMAQFGR